MQKIEAKERNQPITFAQLGYT